jgi:hypothetical protein
MMDSKSLEWQKRFETIWDPAMNGMYRRGSCGLRLINTFLEVMQPSGTVNDYGSGTGRAAVQMVKAGLKVNCIDIATNAMEDEAAGLLGRGITFTHGSLWALPQTFEHNVFGFCCDVLMTIPEDKIDACLFQIRRTCDNLFMEAYPWQDSRCGMDLTATQGDAEYWRKKLEAHWPIVKQYPSEEDHRRVIMGCWG